MKRIFRSVAAFCCVFVLSACEVSDTVPTDDTLIGASGSPMVNQLPLEDCSEHGCANGCVQIDYGVDDNANGVLDTAEVDGSEYICHGTNGNDGAQGSVGVDGEQGAPGAPGADGQDGEQGAPGPDGQDGEQGPVGPDGVNGEDGANGEDGDDGEDGSDCTVSQIECEATLSCEDGTSVSWDLVGCSCDICGVCDVDETNDDNCCAAIECNNGTCEEPDAGTAPTCTCDTGWTGDSCSDDIDECASEPCVHGTCTDLGADAYACACETGWTGENCSQDIDDCVDNPCENGTCTDIGVNAYVCVCDDGWIGGHCDEAGYIIEQVLTAQNDGTVSASNVDTVYDGTLIASTGGWSHREIYLQFSLLPAVSEPGFCGFEAATLKLMRGSSPMTNSGGLASLYVAEQTIWLEDELTWRNRPVVSGEAIETMEAEDYANGASVTNVLRTAWDEGEYDITFNLSMDPAPSARNDFGSRDSSTMYPVLEVEYRDCGEGTGVCEMDPCEHGTCVERSEGFDCGCDLGWTGDLCDQDVDDCELNPCKNGGACTDTGAYSFSCACPDHFEGDTCNRRQKTDDVLILFDSGGPVRADMGGRVGANAICSASPNIPTGCERTAAFLSIDENDEIRDMPYNYPELDTSSRIVGANGLQVADDWADLLDGSLDNTLNDADAVADDPAVFHSGSYEDGSVTNTTCNGYTTYLGGAGGNTGRGNHLTRWAGTGTSGSCATSRLICMCY